MPKNLADYLQVDYELAGIDPRHVEVRLVPVIEEVEGNPFYLRVPGEYTRHFRLNIRPDRRVLVGKDKSSEWEECVNAYGGYMPPLCFYMSTEDEPDMAAFSEYIHKECSAVLFALHEPPRDYFYFYEKGEITMREVYIYLNLKCPEYDSLPSFIKYYPHWKNYMYRTQRWFHYLLDYPSSRSDEKQAGWLFPVGDKLMDFISPSDFPLHVEELRSQLT